MPKLKLNLDDLRVESLSALPAPERDGTVLAQDTTDPILCGSHTENVDTCQGNTCDSTCNQLMCGCTLLGGTCDATCTAINWEFCQTWANYPTCSNC